MDLGRGMQAPLSRKRGQGLVEYALIIALIAVVIIIIMTLLGTQVNFIFARITVNMDPDYRGMFSGPALTPTNGVTIAGGGLGGYRVLLNGYQSVTICASVSGTGGSQLICGAPPTLPTQITSACVVAVEGYTLTGPVCKQ